MIPSQTLCPAARLARAVTEGSCETETRETLCCCHRELCSLCVILVGWSQALVGLGLGARALARRKRPLSGGGGNITRNICRGRVGGALHALGLAACFRERLLLHKSSLEHRTWMWLQCCWAPSQEPENRIKSGLNLDRGTENKRRTEWKKVL